MDIPKEDVEPKQIILDPDYQPMWESAKTIAPTPNYAIIQLDVDDNFVINTTHLNMIRENKFDGYLQADPHDHIRNLQHVQIRKAFKVFNSRTRIVPETLHVNFMENKPNVAGSGPAWLFDIDSLSQTMNYHPVLAKNQTNSNAGFQDTEKAREEGTHTYVLFPVLSDGSTNPKNNKDALVDGKEHGDNIQKSMSSDIHSSSCGHQTTE
nr:ribonuclease H-like domain-containing protein [Tanacetum cinerariifolium]